MLNDVVQMSDARFHVINMFRVKLKIILPFGMEFCQIENEINRLNGRLYWRLDWRTLKFDYAQAAF